MWDWRTALGEGPWYRNLECQPHLPLLLGAQREWGSTLLSVMTGQMPPPHPGALRAKGRPPSLPPSRPPPGCWLAVGLVHPSGSELLGTAPHVCPFVTCAILKDVWLVWLLCLCPLLSPPRAAMRVTACPFVVSDVCNQTQPCH